MKEKERHELFSRSKINDISLLDGRKNKYVSPLVLITYINYYDPIGKI